MAKNFRDSHSTIDVEKIYKRTLAIISACWACVELVSGGTYFSLKNISSLTDHPSATFSGLCILNVIVLLSHVRHSDGTKNSISKR